MKSTFYFFFPFLITLFTCLHAQDVAPSIWISVGEDAEGSPAAYRPFKGNTACDDCSELISLPFTFTSFGKKYSNVFINSNGNLTFGGEWTEFTPSPFCLQGPNMVAPFYADVDLAQCGTIDYLIRDQYVIVTWTEVCHYHGGDTPTSLHNSFQVILTDGNITQLRGQKLAEGTTVIFNYGDMQWTTGQSSGSLTGFGGAAATVGLNQGDGMTCNDYGIFDHEGTDYVGYSTDHNDIPNGVSHLDDKTLMFNGNAGTYLVPGAQVSQPMQMGNSLAASFSEGIGVDKSSLSAWPNPFQDRIKIDFIALDDQEGEIKVIDAAGRPVYQKIVQLTAGSNPFNIALQDVPKGLYYVNVVQGKKRVGLQLVKS